MRSRLLIFLLVFIQVMVFAQERPEIAPLSIDFINYFHGKNDASDNGLYGYVPSPYKVNFNIEPGKQTSLKSGADFPLKFDLRVANLVTPVKNQGSTGSCWTFATIGSIESRWKKLETIEYNLSEQNIGMCHGFDWGINDGGNDMIAAAYLTRLSGPVAETDDPYQGLTQTECKTGLIPVAYAPEVVWLPNKKDIIKEYLMKYGAIAVSMYTGGSKMYTYYNSSDYTFYYTGETGHVDHAVLVVGWDDSKTVTGGSSSTTTTGAWIVKNSWGTTWGESGYFYVAYDDNAFLSTAAYYPYKEELGFVDELKMDDELGMVTSIGFHSEDMWGMMHIPISSPTFINSIGTFLTSDASSVHIQAYKTFQGDTLLKDLITEGTFSERFPGYYRFDLPFVADTDVWVTVKYHTPNYGYPVPAETEIADYAYPEITNGGTYYYSKNGEKWDSLGADVENLDYDLCIRAYSYSDTSLVPWFTADRRTVCTGSDVTFYDKSSGNPESVEWDFGTGASPQTATGPGPHTVSYSSAGFKTISQTVTSGDNTQAISRNDFIDVVSSLVIYTSATSVELVAGDSLIIEAFGADSYEWTPSETLDSPTGSKVVAKPEDDIMYTVTGTMGSCSGSATSEITIIYPPDNDDICDAFEIQTGYSGTFTNENATVEKDEPAPPEGECDQPMQWCEEGGLQNSVWFTFTGPESGHVSIITEGLDTQLAMYESESCDSVTLDKMVAAFDDYFGPSKYYAAALDFVEVTPGKRYYVQCDGSAGGVEGSFKLSMSESHVGIETPLSLQSNMDMRIFPNPSDKGFTIEVLNPLSGTYNLKITDLSGRVVFNEDNIDGESGLIYYVEDGLLPSGMYLVEVLGKTGRVISPVVIK